jgi:hypothetical protein
VGRTPPYRWLLPGKDPEAILGERADLSEFPRLVASARGLGVLTLVIAAAIMLTTVGLTLR